MRLAFLARHGESTLNVEGLVNGDPRVEVPLTEAGEAAARALGVQLANVPIDLCVTSRFGRAKRTAELALAGRGVPFREEPLLDDIDVGELEGAAVGDYRAWKRAHSRSDAFPGGESLDDAARRYARALRALVALEAETLVVVCHEIPVRYALNGAAGSDDLDGPVHVIANAAPFAFDAAALERAAARIDELSR